MAVLPEQMINGMPHDAAKIMANDNYLLNLTTPLIGSVILYAGSSAPTGYLICNGAEISRSTYSDLFTIIGTIYGIGDGSTTFNIPDMRGIFPRGVGSQTINGRVKGGGALGDKNEDKLQGHYHTLSGDSAGGSSNSFSWAANGDGLFGSDNLARARALQSDGTNGIPRTGATTEPSSLDLNYIIRY